MSRPILFQQHSFAEKIIEYEIKLNLCEIGLTIAIIFWD